MSAQATVRQEFHPPHIREQNTYYFITASTVGHAPWLDTDAKRFLLRNILREAVIACEIQLYAWVILADHYHLLLRTGASTPVHTLIKRLHGSSAMQLNRLDNAPGRKVWYQYWDRCPRHEDEFWKYFNYIHVNPIKHGYVHLAGDGLAAEGSVMRVVPRGALDIHECMGRYAHSSYHHYLRKYGAEFLTDALMQHPIPDYAEGDCDVLSSTSGGFQGTLGEVASG